MIDAITFRARIGYYNLRNKARTLPLKNMNKCFDYGPSLFNILLLYIGILSVTTLCTGFSYSVGPSQHYFPLCTGVSYSVGPSQHYSLKLKSELYNCIQSSLSKLESANYYTLKKTVWVTGPYCTLNWNKYMKA